MNRHFKPFIFGGILSLVWMSAEAGGGGTGTIVYDPTNWIQNAATAASTAQEVTNQITQLQVQAQQYQIELTNIEKLGQGQYVWNDVSGVLNNLSNTIQTGNAIAYSMANVDQQFKQTYPGYNPSQNYSQAYQGYATSTMDTIRGVLDSTSLSFQDFASEESTLDALKGLSTNPQGQMQAIQAGSMIAGQTANELLNLQQIVMAQTNSQSAYQAYQVQKDESKQSMDNEIYTNLNTQWPQYNANNEGFGTIPTFSN